MITNYISGTVYFSPEITSVGTMTYLTLQGISNYTEKMPNVMFALSLLIYFEGIVGFPNMYCLEVRCMHSLLKYLCTISLQNNLIHSIHRNLRDMVFTRFS